MKKILYFVVFLYGGIISTFFAQNLEGIIIDFETQIGISSAIVEVMDNENKVLLFDTTNKHGEYSISLDNFTLGEYSLMISKHGFASEIQTLNHQNTSQIINFELRKDLINLQDIVVKAKPKPIRVKNDTTSYHADSYKDGSERVVEDLLKKLPGVDVAENGTIKYKGREISKLLLDGDDLFGYNYVTGSKNISVGIIDQVQAIENWSENKLLKGIEDSQAVALNLKLKKAIHDLSGNASLGYGIENRYEAGINTILLNHRNKNFNSLSYNNTGKNNTPWNYFSFVSSREQQEISNFISNKPIPEKVFSGSLSQDRATRNQLFFASVNDVFKLNNATTARINFNYLQDKLDLHNTSLVKYNFENQEDFSTYANEFIQKKPQTFYGDSKITWSQSEKSMWEWESKWMDEKINTSNLLKKNFLNSNISTDLQSNTYFHKHQLNYTHKLNLRQVLQMILLFAQNSSPQYFDMSQDLNHDINENINFEDAHQFAKTERNIGLVNLSFLGVNKKLHKYSLGVTGRYQKDFLPSHLEIESPLALENQIKLSQVQSQVYASYLWNKNKWKLKSNLKLTNDIIQFQQQEMDSLMNKIVINPEVSFSYNVSPDSKIFIQSQLNQRRQDISNLYENFILTSYRSLRKNETNFAYQDKFNSKIGFNHYDLYQQFQFTLFLNFEKIKNNRFSENLISQDFTQTKYIILPKTITNLNTNLLIEKYVSFLKSTIRFGGNYAYLDYFNFVNNSDLRNNSAHSGLVEFSVHTAFSMPLNFQNKFQIQYFRTELPNKSYHSNSSIQNEAKLIFKPKKLWFSSLTFEYFNPMLGDNNPFYFLDFDIIFRPKNKNWDFAIEARNLTNNKHFEQIFVSDYYQEQNSQSLNERYIIFKYNFRF